MAAESKIIRQEVKRARGKLAKDQLALHRISVVRGEARHTHLALALCRGTPYSKVEANPKTKPKPKKIERMIERLGGGWYRENMKAVHEWILAAKLRQ